jgi:hypothetical protein
VAVEENRPETVEAKDAPAPLLSAAREELKSVDAAIVCRLLSGNKIRRLGNTGIGRLLWLPDVAFFLPAWKIIWTLPSQATIAIKIQ